MITIAIPWFSLPITFSVHEATYIIRKIHDKLLGLAVQMKYMLVSYSIRTCIHDKVYKLNILSYPVVRAEAIKLCIAIIHAQQSYKQNWQAKLHLGENDWFIIFLVSIKFFPCEILIIGLQGSVSILLFSLIKS